MKVNLTLSTPTPASSRAHQIGGMFDVPITRANEVSIDVELPIENIDWNVGLIVGPSGSGKSTVARELWPEQMSRSFRWNGDTLIDSFDESLSTHDIAMALSSVGFSTIPAWLRPFSVLSNGEQFRATIARHMLTDDDPIVIDEFTSVIDRHVAQIASHAVQKYVRRQARRLVAVTCHYDVEDWLQPDWILDMKTKSFRRRRLRRRPELHVEMGRVSIEAWNIFKKYHYMNANIHKACRCFGLWLNGELCTFVAMLKRVTTKQTIQRTSRIVTLPDFQGLGLAFVLLDFLGSVYKRVGETMRAYPMHMSFIRSFDRSPKWKMTQRPGKIQPFPRGNFNRSKYTAFSRGCAVFQYIGPAASSDVDAIAFLNGARVS